MRAHAELAATAARLEHAATRGPDPSQTAARLSALKLVAGDLIHEVETNLPSLAAGGPGMAGRAACHLLGAGGKRVRPLLVVLAARAAGASADGAAADTKRAHLTQLAQAAELVHAATLLHDDVLDDGRTRRGLPAARMLWGNAASVLGGDFLLVRALELTAATGVPRALDELLMAVARMIDGEALQLEHRGRSDLDSAGYLDVVDGKTASLFAWCGRAGARLAGAGEAAADALGRYGLHLGRAFQIVDDVLDVEGDPRALGKSVLSDLREGKLTLPVLYALDAHPALRQKLAACAAEDHEGEHPVAGEVAEAVHQSGATVRARRDAAEETRRALEALAALDGCVDGVNGAARDALGYIAEQLCARVA